MNPWRKSAETSGSLVNTLVRSLSKNRAKACDQRLPRLIFYIDLTTKLQTSLPFGKQHWRLQTCFYVQDASFASDSWDSKSASRGLLCVFGSYTHVSISLTCKKHSAVSHSSAQSETLSLDAGSRMDGSPALQCGECVLETLSSKPAEGNLEHHHAKESFRLIHIMTIVYLSQLIRLRPAFPTSHSQPNSARSKTSRQWSKWSTDDEGASHERTESMLISCLRKCILGSFNLWFNMCEQQIKWRTFWDKKGMLTPMQWYSLLTLWRIRRPCEANDVRSFFSHASLLLSLCTAPSNVIRWWHKPTALTRSGVHTHQKYWNQVAFWIITWPWNTWAITSLIGHRTRGIFLQECSSPWVRRETYCKLILHLRSWETNGFVRQVALSTENCRQCTTVFRFYSVNGTKQWASKFTRRCNYYLEHYRESARSNVGQQIPFIFDFFLVAKRTRQRSRSMSGFDKVKQTMDTQKRFHFSDR